MTLLERLAANRCAVQGCQEPRVADGALCAEDLTLDWRRLLVRQPDGTFTHRRALTARDMTRSAA